MHGIIELSHLTDFTDGMCEQTEALIKINNQSFSFLSSFQGIFQSTDFMFGAEKRLSVSLCGFSVPH